MESDLILPVAYAGKLLELPAKFVPFGYIVKLEVDIEGATVTFEPDKERNWRAMISYEDAQANKKLDTALLELIAKDLEIILK